MTDPAQDAAARGALQSAAVELACAVEDLIIREVVRLRRRNTKIPFYSVTVEQSATGTQLRFEVSDDGQRVELDSPRTARP